VVLWYVNLFSTLLLRDNRRGSMQAPVIALYANLNTPVPIFIAGAVFITAGIIALLLPYESRGRGSL
jgi:hypothetical protein